MLSVLFLFLFLFLVVDVAFDFALAKALRACGLWRMSITK
jgi:hypothetical protein